MSYFDLDTFKLTPEVPPPPRGWKSWLAFVLGSHPDAAFAMPVNAAKRELEALLHERKVLNDRLREATHEAANREERIREAERKVLGVRNAWREALEEVALILGETGDDDDTDEQETDR